jgi:hypothetical protein
MPLMYTRWQLAALVAAVYSESFSPLSTMYMGHLSRESFPAAMVRLAQHLDAHPEQIYTLSLADAFAPDEQAIYTRNREHVLLRANPARAGFDVQPAVMRRHEGGQGHASPRTERQQFKAASFAACARIGIGSTHAAFQASIETVYRTARVEFQMDRRCRICKKEMAAQRSRDIGHYGPGTVNPRVLTIDAILPRRRGGLYTPDNIQLLCMGCNLCKWFGTTEEGQLLVGMLGRNKDLRVDERGLLVAKRPDVPHRPSAEALRPIRVSTWAAHELPSLGIANERHLTVAFYLVLLSACLDRAPALRPS